MAAGRHAHCGARGSAQPDAFALAVYDAVWVTAQAYLAAGGRGRPRCSQECIRHCGE